MQGGWRQTPGRRRRQSVGPLVSVAAACVLLAVPAAAGASAQWRAHAEAAASSGKRIDVVLRLSARSGVQRLARSVTAPESQRYGQYVRPTRIATRFGARKRTRTHVRSFLRRRGIRSRVDVTRSFAEALVPARMARRLFGPSKKIRGRIPPGLRGSVRAVLQETANRGQSLPRARRNGPVAGPAGASGSAESRPPHARTGTPAGCAQGLDATAMPLEGSPVAGPAFTPNQIQAAYRASRLHDLGVTGKGVTAAVLGAGGFARPELEAFAECFGIDVPPTSIVEVGTRGAGKTSVESALDLQMLTLMAPGLERLVVYDVASGLWPAFFSALLEPRNAPDGRLPHVVSVSAGGCENDLSRAQVRLTERVLAAAAAAGMTVAAGSGDNGSYCLNGKVGFYPSSSRWATSVGGTSLALEGSNEIADEIVWNDVSAGLLPRQQALGSGGGGLSSFLAAPFYQRRLDAWQRRAYPDVASMADLYPGIAIYCGADQQSNCDPDQAANPFEPGFGTSAATPLFAGIAALANQRRLETGAPPIGFANPLLYGLAGPGGGGVLRDVVRGSNELLPFGCCEAHPGFDLASGWGSVDAEALAGAALLRAR